MKNREKMLKPEQMAEMLNVARKTVVTMAREGRIPSIRLGRFYRFDSEEIDRWIQKNRCS
jgi:excisionase family DNA binding protein